MKTVECWMVRWGVKVGKGQVVDQGINIVPIDGLENVLAVLNEYAGTVVPDAEGAEIVELKKVAPALLPESYGSGLTVVQ